MHAVITVHTSPRDTDAVMRDRDLEDRRASTRRNAFWIFISDAQQVSSRLHNRSHRGCSVDARFAVCPRPALRYTTTSRGTDSVLERERPSMGFHRRLIVAAALASTVALKNADACSCVFGASLCDKFGDADIILRGTVSAR